MKDKEFKLGFSEIGGIFIGKDIDSAFHKNYTITVLISFDEPFHIKSKDKNEFVYQAALINKNIEFSLKTSKNNLIAFIHISPYSDIGIKLSGFPLEINQVDYQRTETIIQKIKDWLFCNDNKSEKVVEIIQTIGKNFGNNNIKNKIDKRIYKSFDVIKNSKSEKISVNEVAPQVGLSVSHFNRLFKAETGLTFRKFVLQNKLINSLRAIHQDINLTQSAFIGGFSDQAHFSRTFKHNFGINPSTSRK